MSVLEEPAIGLSTSAAVEVEGEELIYALSQRIFVNLQTLAKSKPVLSQEVEKTRSKFQKWCNTLGANIRGVYSLDERLRDASAVKRYIVNCLGDIAEALEETQAVSHKPEATLSSPSRNEDAALKLLIEKSVISDPLGFENSMLDVLFLVIPVIRPALSPDRYEKAMATELPDEEEFKRLCSDNLISLFPAISPALLARLVSASLQRRRFFQYTSNYSLKFQSAGPVEDQESPNYTIPRSDGTDEGDTESILSRADSKLTLTGAFGQERPTADNDTDSMMSMAKSNRDMAYSVPAFPDESEGGLRECVACHLTLPLRDKATWRTHILRDIRPYVCTFPDCNVDPNKLYSSRRVWFEHELKFHRRQWFCPLGCATIIEDLTSLQAHVASVHPTHIRELISDALPRMQEISANAEAQCPFCLMNIKPRRKIESHIAWHQVQVGLMVLQSSVIEDSDEEDEAEQEEEEEVPDMPSFPSMDLPVQQSSNPVLSSPHISDIVDNPNNTSSESLPKEISKAGIVTKSAKWDDWRGTSPKPSESLPKESSKAGIVTKSAMWDDWRGTSPKPISPKTQTANLSSGLETASSTAASLNPHYREAIAASAPVVDGGETHNYSNERLLAGKPYNIGLSPGNAKRSSSTRHTWFLMPNFDFTPTPDSPVRLGQVLTNPLHPEDGIIDPGELDAILPQWKMNQTRSRQSEATYELGGLRVRAITLETLQLQQVAQCVDKLGETPEVRRILREKNRFGSRKVYVITGLKVITDSQVNIGEEKSLELGVSAGIPLGPEVSIGYGSTIEKGTSYRIAEPVIFAYCLAQVRTSFLGVQAIARYTKGAVL
ncbi:hypothetical protein GLAREA_12078 [Glarea lozoyensis ATCC 20868]|uniref:C2H2-type domain-containing protein n=1 Tax=Glarea lozoyensis (strain ATCC 20868 / MF5171) TaxID=1116229 RepID=S3DIY5_GLAL2|nr:uncharacterized protein GLAREA_12078 [Glarea lozoyensis ATCC 20868]EPE31996.1 hypothetical protein GLAREA_12078 [Glarea lozoyensis ATCC 20868]